MSLREKVRRVFRRSSSGSKSKDNSNPIKIEYYKRHEIPPSKFKGPFDREHQKRLAAWSFGDAQDERPRSPDLSLSPCASLPGYLRPRVQEDSVAPDEVPSVAPEDLSDASATISDDERQENSGSTSSTAYDPDSYSSSMMTLFDEVIRQARSPTSRRRSATRHPWSGPSPHPHCPPRAATCRSPPKI
ncbi:hypothetical protein ABOM_008164 [Aspergillus bombycis]|uniref:Uncharacterized protein n=1 Tax=Aspergillus bombycis TaxID=109264 RepID=A0A1F7ZUH6_9EURO|nr:hypothetical protein ABOM_008164 [Aspergillus bombycis]OGM42738.1 hypothetical protein ABOM_008164 [Aspergillus bombycis]